MRMPLLLAALLLVESTRAVAAESDMDVQLVRIKAAEVEKVIAKYKGKVVVLDVWGEF